MEPVRETVRAQEPDEAGPAGGTGTRNIVNAFALIGLVATAVGSPVVADGMNPDPCSFAWARAGDNEHHGPQFNDYQASWHGASDAHVWESETYPGSFTFEAMVHEGAGQEGDTPSRVYARNWPCGRQDAEGGHFYLYVEDPTGYKIRLVLTRAAMDDLVEGLTLVEAQGVK